MCVRGGRGKREVVAEPGRRLTTPWLDLLPAVSAVPEPGRDLSSLAKRVSDTCLSSRSINIVITTARAFVCVVHRAWGGWGRFSRGGRGKVVDRPKSSLARQTEAV